VSDSEHDDEFEEYLKRRVPIDKGANPLEPLEPPPELDRIVIGKARKAIQGAAPIHLYRAPKWALPVGLAATILLSFAILLDLGVRAKRNAALQAASSPTSGIATSQSPAGGVEPQTPAAQTPKPAPALAAPSAPEQELYSDKTRTRLAKAEKAAKRARPEQAIADRGLQEISVAGSRRQDAVASAAPIAAVAPPADAMQSIPPPASEPVPSSPEESQLARATGSEGATQVEKTDPVSWLARIEKLRSTGQTAEAEREMKRFRATYPDYPVPKDRQ
jgi:hypothetical protein